MHPADFTPVCTTELGAAQSLKAEFYARGTKLCGFSCDDANCHRAWVADIEAATGQRLDFPLFCDPDRKHAIELGVFDPQLKNDVGLPQTVRSVFILKPDKTIALTMTYPSSVGRNFDEILRVLDALQREWNFGVNTPANWQPGDRTIVPYNMNDEQAEEIFGKVNVCVSYFASSFHFFVIIRLIASSFLLASQNGFIAVDLPSERGKDIKKHYLRYADDPILTDTTNKQSTKLSSRIGKIKSWKPPKSFLPFAGSLSSTSMKRRRNTSGRKSQLTPVSSAEKDSGIEKNECKIKSELDLKQNVSVSDDNKHNNWKQFLSVGLSALKSEIVEHQGTKQPDSKESGTDDSQSEKDRECRERRRFSRNSAGSEVVW